MLPGVDPRTMKNMMAKMGIKSTDIKANRVTIECDDIDIVIDNPQVTKIEMQGTTSFQVVGDVSESENDADIEISDDDINMVKEKTGIEDTERIREALEESNGDIAQAILKLSNPDES